MVEATSSLQFGFVNDSQNSIESIPDSDIGNGIGIDDQENGQLYFNVKKVTRLTMRRVVGTIRLMV